jgi:hypothetical protein
MLNVNVGIFYELPDGRIVDTFAFDGRNKTISYRFDGGEELLASFEEVETWKPRNDLQDFPNASDPRLPHVFDLLFDIKRMSQLRSALGGWNCSVDQTELRALMAKHNIECEPEEPPESEEFMDTKVIEMALGTLGILPEIKPRMYFDRYIVVHEAAGTYFANAYCISRDYTHSIAFFRRMADDIKIDFPELKDEEIECRIVNKSRLCLNCSVIKFKVPVETVKEGWLKHTFSTEWPEWSVSDF